MVANEKQFQSNRDAIQHEANMVAAISEVLTLEGMLDSEEQDYSMHAENMKQAAQDLRSALELGNYQAGSKAVGVIGQACSQCHADWR